jgi:flagellar hook-associated protein 3 FlgL
MRVADKMNYAAVNSNLSKNRQEMLELSNQASTQKKINRPSDDPLAATRILATRSDIQAGEQFQKNIAQAKAFLEFSEQSLNEISDILIRAKELAVGQSNDASANQDSRAITATEIRQLFEQTVQVGNRKIGDRYIFGGFRTNRPPFLANGQYRGDGGEIQIAVNKDQVIPMNVPGSRVFLGRNLPSVDDARATEPGPTIRPPGDAPGLRGPSSVSGEAESSGSGSVEQPSGLSGTWNSGGVNVFDVLSDLEVSLRANDKGGVQESLDRIDEALAQVVLTRSQMGSRMSTMQASLENLQKAKIEGKTLVSNLEDADTFELVSDINRTESTLKAALQTSGKLIQPSLLDFLR